jgi:hypothetical protein
MLVQFILILHIVAGVSTLVTGPMAIFYNFKNVRNHRMVGKAFFYAMLLVCITAVIGWLKRPDAVFYQFLLGISILVLAGIFRGVRSIFLMKGDSVRRFDWIYTIMLGLNGLWMLGMSAWHFQLGSMIAFPILFAVFGMGALSDTWKNYRQFLRAADFHKLDWMKLHTASMLGAFTASTTAFTVNAAHFLPWWAQWFGPTLLLLPIQIYFGRKINAMKPPVAPTTHHAS